MNLRQYRFKSHHRVALTVITSLALSLTARGDAVDRTNKPLIQAGPQAAGAESQIGGHADLCVIGKFYRAAQNRRVSQISIMDSNGINADSQGSYGYVFAMHEAAFEDDSYECWAAGMYSGSFTPSINPVFSSSVSQPININSPFISGFAGAFKGSGAVNGAHLSVHNGINASSDSFAGIRSVIGFEAPPWFLWETLPITFHYTTFRDTLSGNGSMQLLISESDIPRLIGDTQPTNGATQDTVIDDSIVGMVGDLPRTLGVRLRLMAGNITGQAVWNYIIPEATNRTSGFHFTQLWIKSGGRATEAAQEIANASREHMDKVFERLSTVQNERNPMMIVQFVIGGNDWLHGGAAQSVIASIDDIRTRCEVSWLNAGNAREDIVFLIVGYHPRLEDPNFGYRNELRDYALTTERVAFYDPAVEFTIQDMIDNRYSDNQVTGNDPHMSDLGYRAFASRQLQVIKNTASAGPADLNNDGVVNTADLGVIIRSFGAPHSFADLNADGAVDVADLGELLAEFGSTACDARSRFTHPR